MVEMLDDKYLVLDQGNTRLKITVFDSAKNLIFSKVINEILIDPITEIVGIFNPKGTLYSASGKINKDLISFLEKLPKFIFLDSNTKLPISIDYKTPLTLGVDRIANVCGAQSLFPDRPSLVIDFGTCITYNFIDEKRCFLGGAIAPGLAMRAKAMNTFTENLPLVEFYNGNSFIGKDTESCLNVGIMEGVKHEIQGYINQYSAIYPNLTIIFTGGDHSYFVNTIECTIFADLNLTAIGLNEILQYNK